MNELSCCRCQKPIELTVFIPCYNEQEAIVDTITNVAEVCQRVVPDSWEILIIDDASSDLSPELIQNFIQKTPALPIRLLKNEVNQGFAFNFAEAAFRGQGKYFRVIHGGNIEPLDTQIKILESRELADIVIEIPDFSRTRSSFRRFLSKAFNIICNVVTGYSIKYWNGAVLHKRYNVMRWHSNTRGHSFLLLLVFQCLEEGCSYKEIPVEHLPRSKKRKAKSLTFANFCSIFHSFLTIVLYRIRKAFFGK
ncbi:MAG: glycosyltransferase [Pseudomonadota bacterium]